MVASRESDDFRLISQAQRGDTVAFDVLVRRYQDVAFRTAWIILRNEPDAQDAAQTAFIKAWVALSRFRPEDPFRPWLLRIVANEAKNRRDSGWRWRHLQQRIGRDVSDNPEPSPLDLVATAETSRELLSAISRLRESDQRVILLRYAMDLNEREMSEVLDVPIGTVKSRLHRALKRLQEVMGDDFA